MFMAHKIFQNQKFTVHGQFCCKTIYLNYNLSRIYIHIFVCVHALVCRVIKSESLDSLYPLEHVHN